MNEGQYHIIPQPNEISTRERDDAMGAYLMMFASLAVGLPLPIINLIAAIIYYYVNRKKSRFVHFHALQSLISQIPTSILNASAVFWTFAILFRDESDLVLTENDVDFNGTFPSIYVGYIIMVIIANLVYIVFSIVAASRAHKGRFYYMLFFGRVAYNYVFSTNNTLHYGQEEVVNQPPR